MSQDDKKYSILDEMTNSNGYDIALMTTFNFEIGFFERAVLNRLYACDVKKVSLFVDSKELNKALKEVSDCYLGKRYMVTPVEMSSSFHPKVILLLGPQKAKLFVGSANIKTSGYAINNEIFNFKEYSLDEPKYLDIINTAIDFFSDINERSLGLDSVIIKEAKNQLYYHKADSNGECFLINNLKDTILNQVRGLINETIKEVRIAVPYYDNGLAAFTAIKEKYADAGIRLYIQDKKSSFPVDLNEKTRLVENIELFSGFENGGSNCCDNFYHGKVFLFKGNSHDYILYGSANCTKSALTKSFEDGGNIECDLLEVGATGEFDYFFEGMKFISGKKPESNIMIFDANEDNNFFFRYGQLKESVELHIGYAKRIDSLKILLQDLELKHEYQNKEIIVYLPEEYRTAITNIFELSFVSTDGTENVRCWYYNAIEIENYRLKQSDRGFLDGFEIDASGDKYVEDRINLLKAELTSLPEFLEHKKNIAIYNQIKQEQEGEDLESSDDDFIVDAPITDEYRASYRQYNIVSKIRRQFMRRFLVSDSAIFKSVEDSETKISNEGSENNFPESEKHYRPATSAEKRFERFVKGKVRAMLNEKYVEIIGTEHYLGIIAVVLDIFYKYKNEELVEDIFTTDYIVNTRLMFFSRLLKKDLFVTDEIDDFQTKIITKCFAIMIDNHLITEAFQDQDEARKVESDNRALLFQLEKKYKLRDCYPDYIREAINLGESAVCVMGNERTCQYFEKLYGYKSTEMLLRFIQDKYDNATVEQKGKTVLINATSNIIKEHHQPNTEVLREIAKYGMNVFPIDSVTIMIKNTAPNADNKNIIIHIKHNISMVYHNWRVTEKRADGKTCDSKSQYISF